MRCVAGCAGDVGARWPSGPSVPRGQFLIVLDHFPSVAGEQHHRRLSRADVTRRDSDGPLWFLAPPGGERCSEEIAGGVGRGAASLSASPDVGGVNADRRGSLPRMWSSAGGRGLPGPPLLEKTERRQQRIVQRRIMVARGAGAAARAATMLSQRPKRRPRGARGTLIVGDHFPQRGRRTQGHAWGTPPRHAIRGLVGDHFPATAVLDENGA